MLDDGLLAREEELAGVKALALLVLALLDVLARGLGKDDLKVGVDVDLGDAELDGLLDLVQGDAGATVQDERQVAREGLDLAEALEGETLPVGRVDAVDVADAAGKEVDAEVGDGLALLGVGQLAGGGHAVLGAADAANLGLDGDALGVGELDDLGRAVDVGLEVGLVGAVIHDRGEAGLDALETSLVGAVVQVQGNRHGNVLVLDELTHHVSDDLEAGLPLGGTRGALDDDRALRLLGGVEDGGGPLEVVGVEGTNAVVALLGVLKHSGCIDEHVITSVVEDRHSNHLEVYPRPRLRGLTF